MDIWDALQALKSISDNDVFRFLGAQTSGSVIKETVAKIFKKDKGTKVVTSETKDDIQNTLSDSLQSGTQIHIHFHFNSGSQSTEETLPVDTPKPRRKNRSRKKS